MRQCQMIRRSLIATAASLPLAALPRPALAEAPMLGPSTTRFRRFRLGGFEITTLLSSSITRPDPHAIFGLNVSADIFAQVSRQSNLPVDQAQFFFTPTIVNTGTDLILFDTGLSAGDITGALAAAGYTPDQVDMVVITHMHGDHIGGLMHDGTPTFANARYVTGAVEFDAWTAMGNEKFDANMRPLAEQTMMIDPGGRVASGITALKAFGHTPGHMAYMIESQGRSLLIAADFANHYVWSLAQPEWEVKFDMDKTAAASTRLRLLDMLASDQIPFIGYHMPWPAVGYIETRNGGYAYAPESYQLTI